MAISVKNIVRVWLGDEGGNDPTSGAILGRPLEQVKKGWSLAGKLSVNEIMTI